MILSDISIKRPVFATVLSLLLIVFGVICYLRLPLREYPDIDKPIVNVRTTYTGAAANVVETRITKPLEDSVSGISGLKSIESSSEDGQSSISLEFDISVDMDEAANDVRDKINRAAASLPDEADTPRIYKQDANSSPVLILSLYHPTMSAMELTDYADRTIIDDLSVVDGVSEVRIYGEKRYSMRVWIDRKAMAARGITVSDIEAALTAENVELPAGRLESKDREFVLRVERLYRTPEEFASLVIREGGDGYLVRLGDIAKVEIGPESTRDFITSDGKNAVGLAVTKQSKANTLRVIEGVKKAMAELAERMPEGMLLTVNRDDSVFINAAVREVFSSLGISAVLVIVIIFLFLGNVRAALVPAITVPISLISSFLVLYWLGYSVNLLTLLSLVLSIGLVVDDSIVVLENIHRRVEEGEPRLVAAYHGAREVGFAVIATTLVLLAVFMPICLISGDTGKLFTEFAVATGAAVCFSSLVALTLSPMMCGRILQARTEEGWLARMDEQIFGRLERWYGAILHRVCAHPYMGLFAFILVCGLGVTLYSSTSNEFEPAEDRAIIIVNATTPEGTGFEATSEFMDKLKDIPLRMKEQKLVDRLLMRVPGSRNSEGAVNSGFLVLLLPYWDERSYPSSKIVADLYQAMGEIPGVRAFIFEPSGISGFGGQPVQFVLGGSNYEELVKWRDIIMEKAREYPGMMGVDSDYKETMPQKRVVIDRDRANKLGVSASVIGKTLETMLGSKQVTTYIDDGEEYDVILQGRDEDRRSDLDLSNIYVRSGRSGELIPLSNLVKITEQADAGKLNRYNRLRSITISASVAPGYTLGDCLKYLENAVRTELPAQAKVNYKGMSKNIKESTSSMAFVFVLAILVVYLVLAAQFESFLSPLVIMLTVPVGLVGALIGMKLMGVTLNIYSQIGLVMIIGLAAKNGILIVEFANQLRDRGLEFSEAVYQAAQLRLRPILMTGLSTAIGAVPLVIASGAGMNSRISLGAVICFGSFFACILNGFIVPLAYLYLARRSSTPKKYAQMLKEQGIE